MFSGAGLHYPSLQTCHQNKKTGTGEALAKQAKNDYAIAKHLGIW